MFTQRIAALALLMLSSTAYAQELALTWTYKDALSAQMVPFVFNFYGPTNQAEPQKTTRIEVINEATHQPIQIFTDLDIPTIERRFSLIDVNFDGIKDICVNNDAQRYYFVFNKENGQFQRNPLLEQIANATFDPQQKQVMSYEQSEGKLRKTYYEYEGNRLVLARQEIQTCDANNHCETSAFVREKSSSEIEPIREPISAGFPKADGLAYLNSLSNQKFLCLALVGGKQTSPEINPSELLKTQQKLSECYKKMIIDVANKFYPNSHFGQDLEHEINTVVERHHRLLHKIAHCPSSKTKGCQYYEEYDALAGTVDYLNELVEFMVLNIGEGYPEFNPEQWLKKWDGPVAS